MGVNLGLTRQIWVGNDPRWIGSELGTRSNRSVTLDLSLFNFAATFTEGKLPSGIILGKVTASGLYGPYSDAAGDGRTTATGILFTDVDVMEDIANQRSTSLTGSVLVPMFIHGIVIEAKLPTNHGLDANGKANLPFIQFI